MIASSTGELRSRSLDWLAMLLGVAITLTLRGYQFGTGNHCVYLVAPLRDVQPELFANDWWVTHTLQYHVAFIKLTAWLMRAGIVRPAFLTLYLALVVLLHLAWRRLVRAMGLDARTYLLSVLLYYVSAAGTGLGSYQFLQDSSFLPGNVANVAMLWGLVLWLEGGAIAAAAAALALASLFHLNHAIVALAFWPAASCFAAWRSTTRREIGRALAGFFLILAFALPNLIPAARTALTAKSTMPLAEFVDLYVHLRHPHHYDPLSWPVALWMSFLWPLLFAALWWQSAQTTGRPRVAFAFLFFTALPLIALIFAGLLFVSEPLIQMSLFRFSIYLKLISCVAAAGWIVRISTVNDRVVRSGLVTLPILLLAGLLVVQIRGAHSPAGTFVTTNFAPLLLFVALVGAGAVTLLGASDRWQWAIAVMAVIATVDTARQGRLGLRIALADDEGPAYVALCRWAREHTPVNAVFVVPPNEQLFRFEARRAIVVNFKNVPQLASEIGEWRARLEAVLDEPLSALPRRFDLAHAAIAARYDALSDNQLAAVAHRYGARYVVTTHPLAGRQAVFENNSYHLYDLAP